MGVGALELPDSKIAVDANYAWEYRSDNRLSRLNSLYPKSNKIIEQFPNIFKFICQTRYRFDFNLFETVSVDFPEPATYFTTTA